MPESSKPEMVTLEQPERLRRYIFPDGQVEIRDVIRICVRTSGSHRLETGSGQKWIISTGWLAIQLDVDEWTL